MDGSVHNDKEAVVRGFPLFTKIFVTTNVTQYLRNLIKMLVELRHQFDTSCDRALMTSIGKAFDFSR